MATIFGLATSIVNVGDPGVARLSIKDNWFILEGAGLTRRYINPDFVIAFVLAREADIGS